MRKLESITFQDGGFVTLKDKRLVMPRPLGGVSCFKVAKKYDINVELRAVERVIEHEKLNGGVNSYNIYSKFIDQGSSCNELHIIFQLYKTIEDSRTKRKKEIKFIKFKNRGFIEIDTGDPIKVNPIQNVFFEIAPYVALGWQEGEEFIKEHIKENNLKKIVDACCCMPLHPLKKNSTLKCRDAPPEYCAKFVAIQLYKI